MKQWARLHDKPLLTHAGPYGKTLTRDVNSGRFHNDSKHEKTIMLVPSSISPLSPNEAVPPPFRDVADEDTLLELPSWTPLAVSDSECSVHELPLGAEEVPSSTARRKMLQKHQNIADRGPPTSPVPQREVQHASSRISGVYSKSRDSRGSPSLQEVLQATFNANGSYNISPPVTPIDSEGSSTTDGPIEISSQHRPRINSTRRRTSQQDSAVITVVGNALLPKAITAVPKTAPQRAIPYESMQEVIDAALDTQVARISWRRRRHVTRYGSTQQSQDGTSRTNHFPFEDAIFDFDVPTSAYQRNRHNEIKPGLASVEDEHRALPRKFTRMLDHVQTASVPQKSSGEKFNERLDAMFGGAERPHSLRGLITRATADSTSIFTPVREVVAEKEPSAVSSSDSGTSINTSLPQSTIATGVSGRNDVSQKRGYTESHLVDEPVRKKQKIHISEDQVFKWIATLQRLVKGKAKIDHKGMEDLSIVLAEIDSVYPHLDSEHAPVTCLQDVLQQLAQLEDIPFRDEYDLRRRADDIIAEWPGAIA
ncbi:uncharacterized protein EDB91DRAFT_372210 [Suillus paluster]|uniref:uncharacterized protein n=1 Tax=Suillus paluster TaxID=48578 RepID=UPI001B86F552|nr:uncharacterized protein EDB91DRAFT_372210 [Suillus paluster]KAG1739890.1 hypothetical protein EDB91DRAFT_372210 [Suillus paluster]